MHKLLGLTLALLICIQAGAINSPSSTITSTVNINYVATSDNSTNPITLSQPWNGTNFTVNKISLSETTRSGSAIYQGTTSGPLYKIWLPLVANPSIYYVATTGNDINPGTRAQPWQTIEKATNSLKSGDTAVVLSGTYDEKIEISTSGITLQAEGKVTTKGVYISGNSNTFRGFTITDPSSGAGIEVHGSDNLIEGNEIYHTMQDGIRFFGSYNTFRRNYLHDILDPSVGDTHVDCFQTWGWNWNTTNVLFEKNICIHNRLAEGNEIIMLERASTAEVRDITFRNNIFVIYNPVYASLNFHRKIGQPEISNITVVNNTIVNFGNMRSTGIEFDNITNASAINNLFINYGDEQTPYIEVEGGANINIHNNAVYNTNGIPPDGEANPGDIWMQNPLVVSISGLDFHLKSNSPLIDAGYYLANLVPDDFDAVIRPQGARYDIGAYEYLDP